MPRIKIPDKKMVVQFPDNMTSQEIEDAIYTNVYNTPVMRAEPEPNLWQKTKDITGTVWDEISDKPEPGVGPVSKKDYEAFEPKEYDLDILSSRQKPTKTNQYQRLKDSRLSEISAPIAKGKGPIQKREIPEPRTVQKSWRKAEPPSKFEEVINRIKESFRVSPEKSANVVTLAEKEGIPPHLALEHYDELTAGTRTQPKPMELYSGLIAYPIAMGLMTNPFGVITGISTFMAADEVENFLISKIQNKEYHPLESRGLAELAPANLNDNAKTALELLDFIGKGALAGKIGKTADKVAKDWWSKLTNRERGLQTLKINEEIRREGLSLGEAIRERVRRAKQEGRYEEEMERFINKYVRSKEKTKAKPKAKPRAKPKSPEEAMAPAEVKTLEQTRKLTAPEPAQKFGKAIPMPPEEQPYGAEPIAMGPEGEATAKEKAKPEKTKFSPGDTAYIRWEATGKDEPVNFRGYEGDQAVVVKDGQQMTVPVEDLKVKSVETRFDELYDYETFPYDKAKWEEFRKFAIQFAEGYPAQLTEAFEAWERTEDLKVEPEVEAAPETTPTEPLSAKQPGEPAEMPDRYWSQDQIEYRTTEGAPTHEATVISRMDNGDYKIRAIDSGNTQFVKPEQITKLVKGDRVRRQAKTYYEDIEKRQKETKEQEAREEKVGEAMQQLRDHLGYDENTYRDVTITWVKHSDMPSQYPKIEPPPGVHGLKSGKPISRKVAGKSITPAHKKRAKEIADKTGNPVAIVTTLDERATPIGRYFLEAPKDFKNLNNPTSVETTVFDEFVKGKDREEQVIEYVAEPAETAPEKPGTGTEAFIPQHQELPPGIETEAPVQDQVLNIDMPELVRLSREVLEGKYPKIKRGLSKKGALGTAKFRGPSANIDLRYDIYKNPTLAKKVLAHEIGHVIDWLPEKQTKRGNILGRIASLKQYMKTTLDSMPTDPSQILSETDRRKLRNQAAKEAKAEGVEGDELKKLIREKYQQRLKEEIHARDLYTKDEIMEELRGLTRTWNPFNPTADANYTKYRYSSKELYAEAVSVLLNDPQLLRFEASKFWDSFWNYAERKPEVMEVYNQIQDELSGVTPEGVHYRARQDLRNGFRKYDQLLGRQAEQTPWRTAAKEEMIDVASAVLSRAKKVNERNIPSDKNPRYKIDQLRHSGSEFELYMSDALQAQKIINNAGLTIHDFGEYLSHLRITHERVRYSKEDEQYVEIANPVGFDRKSSQQVLDEWKETLGPEKWQALERARQKFYENHRKVVEKMRQSEVFSDELMDKIEDAEYYATFQVGKYLEDKYGKGVGASIYRQYGTHQLIANPVTATMTKDLAIIKSINRHIAVRTVVDFLKEHYPKEIETPQKKYDANKGYAVPVEPINPAVKQIKYLDKGKLEVYDVPKEIADAVEMNPIESNLISNILRVSGKPFRHLFVEANPGFWMFNTVRDTMRPAKNIPTLTLTKFIPQYMKALKPAFKSAFGVPDDVVRQMQKGNMLISLENYRGWEASEDAVLAKELKRWHASPESWIKQVVKPIGTAYTYWTNIGKALERTPKVATYQYLKKKFPSISDEIIGHIVRNHGGSPDFLRKGKAYNFYNNLFFFSNAIKEGWRSDIEAARGQLAEKLNLKKSRKQTAAGWWWKHAKYTLLYKFLMYGTGLGLLGEGFRRVMDGASEYDKTNYLVVPIGLTPKGKSVYLRLPTDETGRMVGGLLWKALKDNEGNDFQNLFDYMAGQAPTLHPAIGVIIDAIQYTSGKNPYDYYHGRYAIPEQLFEAQDWDAHKAFLKYLANNSGLSVIHRFKYDDLERVKGELEELVDYPISSNTIGRFLKVTDYGIKQDIDRELKEERTRHARELKDARNAVIKMLNGEALTQEEMVAMIKHPQSVDRNFSVMLARKYGSTWQHALLTAQTKEERVKILKLFFEKHPELVQGKNRE